MGQFLANAWQGKVTKRARFLRLASCVVASAVYCTAPAFSQTAADDRANIMHTFNLSLFHVAKAEWEAAKCQDTNAAAALDDTLKARAVSAGIDLHRAERALSLEQYICCQTGTGRWQTGNCDRVELQLSLDKAYNELHLLGSVTPEREAAR